MMDLLIGYASLARSRLADYGSRKIGICEMVIRLYSHLNFPLGPLRMLLNESIHESL